MELRNRTIRSSLTEWSRFCGSCSCLRNISRRRASELASKRFPAFYLGRHPHRQFISVSATAELAADFGRDVRNLIESAEYQVLFSTKLAADSKAKGKWHT